MFPLSDLESQKMGKRRRSLLGKKQLNSCTNQWVLICGDSDCIDQKMMESFRFFLQTYRDKVLNSITMDLDKFKENLTISSLFSGSQTTWTRTGWSPQLFFQKENLRVDSFSGISGPKLGQGPNFNHDGPGPIQREPHRADCIHWRRSWRRWCLGIVEEARKERRYVCQRREKESKSGL